MGVAPSGKLELTWTNKHLRLLSDDATNVTGTTLYVDAGSHAMGM